MKALENLLAKGGPVMAAILLLSVFLYSGCFRLLLTIARSRRGLRRLRLSGLPPLAEIRGAQRQATEAFRRDRLKLGSMISAAPLLGLLGTITGMVVTFESISQRSAEKSMEGLARGISEVLLATESGLIVAIPGLLAVHLAHRGLRKYLQELNEAEREALAEAPR
jgi:biopolymer transport protein ExbB